jgi:hypothetical protein
VDDAAVHARDVGESGIEITDQGTAQPLLLDGGLGRPVVPVVDHVLQNPASASAVAG